MSDRTAFGLRPASAASSFPSAPGSLKSCCRMVTPGIASNGQNIERHDRASVLGGLNALCRDLAPAAWSCAKIDNHIAGLQEPIFVRDFLKFIGRPAAIAFALRGSHVRVVQLPLEPMPGRGRAAAGLLQFDLKRPVQIWLSLGHE